MSPPHTEAMPVTPTPPDRNTDDWFRLRRDFQLEVTRRVMNTMDLDDGIILAWVAAGHAKRFADVVDASTDEGREIRRLIMEDREAALDRVQRRMTLH